MPLILAKSSRPRAWSLLRIMMGLTKLSVKSLMKGGKKLFTKLKSRITLRAVTQKSAYSIFQTDYKIYYNYVKFNYSWKNATVTAQKKAKKRGQIHGWISLSKAIKKVLSMFFDPDFILILGKIWIISWKKTFLTFPAFF